MPNRGQKVNNIINVAISSNYSKFVIYLYCLFIRSTMSKRSKEYIKKLLIAGVGKRPTVWVCHSMGGLLVKKMLVDG